MKEATSNLLIVSHTVLSYNYSQNLRWQNEFDHLGQFIQTHINESLKLILIYESGFIHSKVGDNKHILKLYHGESGTQFYEYTQGLFAKYMK